MQCSTVQEILSAYLDDFLHSEEKEQIENHLTQCPKCNEFLTQLQNTVDVIHCLDEHNPPNNFRQELRERLEQEIKKKGIGYRIMQRIPASRLATVACFALLVFVTTQNIHRLAPLVLPPAGNQAVTETADYVTNNSIEIQRTAVKEDLSLESTAGALGKLEDENTVKSMADHDKKIIKNIHLSMEVQDFHRSQDHIVRLVEDNSQIGWFIENSHTYRDQEGVSRGNYTIRVPQNDFYQAVNEIELLGQVKQKTISGEDVTQQYIDINARLRNWEAQEEHLLVIYNKANNVDEILRIQNELFRVRENIESMTQQLKYLSKSVDYSTLHLNLWESKLSSHQVNLGGLGGLGRQVWGSAITTTNGLIRLLTGMLVIIGGAIPVLVILLIGWFVYVYIKKHRHNKEG